MSPTRALWLSVVATSGGFAALQTLRFAREHDRVRRVLASLVPAERIATGDDLRAVKHFVAETVRPLPSGSIRPRPMLRDSATELLSSGEGFCGESARLSVLLLRAGGLSANRIYIAGPKWGHVAVEHRWHDEWVLFDAFPVPETYLADELVGSIRVGDLASFPNLYAAVNPWVDLYRVRLPRRLHDPPRRRRLRFVAERRPPAFVPLVLESPALLKALLGWKTCAFAVAMLSCQARGARRIRRGPRHPG